MALDVCELTARQNHLFGDIWLPWLRNTMGLEPQAEDLQAMRDPAGFFGASGGTSFLAFDGEACVGAVAVKGLGDDGFEFCKLVVSDAARGKGAGRALIEACIAFTRDKGGPALWLQSFNKLEVALGLYERMGFQHAPAPAGMAVLDRTEVIMMMPLA